VIDFVDNAVDPATGTIELRAVFANPDLSLFPGLFVRVRVYASRETDALLVDERAIGTDLAGKYVFVLDEENVVEQRFVTLGPLQDDGMIVVEDGLDGSESYIVNGLLRARPGFPVTPQYADSAVVAPVERG
jgi:RND family efflux transporter MFP subunit